MIGPIPRLQISFHKHMTLKHDLCQSRALYCSDQIIYIKCNNSVYTVYFMISLYIKVHYHMFDLILHINNTQCTHVFSLQSHAMMILQRALGGNAPFKPKTFLSNSSLKILKTLVTCQCRFMSVENILAIGVIRCEKGGKYRMVMKHTHKSSNPCIHEVLSAFTRFAPHLFLYRPCNPRLGSSVVVKYRLNLRNPINSTKKPLVLSCFNSSNVCFSVSSFRTTIYGYFLDSSAI